MRKRPWTASTIGAISGVMHDPTNELGERRQRPRLHVSLTSEQRAWTKAEALRRDVSSESALVSLLIREAMIRAKIEGGMR